MRNSLGTVIWFDNIKGYRFIINESGEDVMVHYHSIKQDGYKTLKGGQKVEFLQLNHTRVGKQLRLL